MNRFRDNIPYDFHPPKYSPLLAPLILWISDHFMLRRTHRITEITVSGAGKDVLAAYKRGDALLITPNHSDHADPHVLLHLSRRFRVPLHFMAAREIFAKRGGLQGAMLQRAGIFSIDREGSDLRSIKEALKILFEGRFPLVMFPEGEIYHLNQRLTPLNEGAATLGLRAAKRIRADGRANGALIVPTALRFQYTPEIAKTFGPRLARLETHIGWPPQASMDLVPRIYKFGDAILSLKEIELLNTRLEGTLHARLARLRETLVAEEEQRYFGAMADGEHPTRVRRLRGKVRSILLAGETPDAETLRSCYRSLDRLYTAVQLYSYPGQYLREDPSRERIAETLHKFEEDLFGENVIYGDRSVNVVFCEPIDLMPYTDAPKQDAKQTVLEITTRVENSIRAALQPEKP